ncbi:MULTISPECIES: hypothetical protein [unclassified Streptomyces]|uniref:hypothetical protein n=1 Tax=unclassified Streptomyces TaxID=2593676 RepID=UPI00081E0689|nr:MULTISPECIES: hypothetical protein [unclassified Streptomyces]MYZ34623.1 hypothetical protein [Streptomyces sp. SID4917]SCF68803.1 hypothetical protein GA0115259_101045 [Streptomyces sp. MnatMP-M17]
MAIVDDLRKTLTDPTPLYFAAGTADIAVEQAKKVPGLIEQFRAEAPGRLEAVRNSDPKAVQDKVTIQAREAQATVQAKVSEVFGSLDTDLKKLGESAQDLAMRSLGMAAEYAVRARETYEKVAERGEQTVRTWRGESAEQITEIAVAVEPEPKREPRTHESRTQSKTASRPAPKSEPKAAPRHSETKAAPKPATAKSTTAAKPVTTTAAAKKTAPRKTTPAKKSTPPSAK